jgi:hypothetical protein
VLVLVLVLVRVPVLAVPMLAGGPVRGVGARLGVGVLRVWRGGRAVAGPDGVRSVACPDGLPSGAADHGAEA